MFEKLDPTFESELKNVFTCLSKLRNDVFLDAELGENAKILDVIILTEVFP